MTSCTVMALFCCLSFPAGIWLGYDIRKAHETNKDKNND